MSWTTTSTVDVDTRSDLSRSPTTTATVASVAVAIAAIGSGVFMRAWYLFHRPISSDEAIAGLMARDILHGHFYAFYWGQVYGGVEPYLTAAGIGIFGHSAWVLRGVPVVLSTVAALLTWRVAKRLTPDPVLAILAGAVVWAAPDCAVLNSVIEWGFRGVTLVCGLAILLLVLRILDGDRHWWTLVGLGLATGVGWWSSPEIAYFLVPGGLMFLGHIWARREEIIELLPRVGVLLLAAGVGALPWLWANANSGFQSLKTSAFGTPPQPTSYDSRLHLFFHYSLGMLFNLRDVFVGDWLGGKTLGIGLLLVVLVVLGLAAVLGVIRGGRAIGVAVGVVVFPFLLALSPGTWYWPTGRYIGYVVPLYVMVLTIGAYAVGRVVASRSAFAGVSKDVSRLAGRMVLSVVGGFLVATSLISFVVDPTPGVSLLAGWGDPNRPTVHAIHVLEKAGVSYGYADYWVAYRLDYLSDEHLKLSVGRGEVDRWPALYRQVSQHPRAAWVFGKPTALASSQFVSVSGPGGLTETAFTNNLKLNSIPYKIVDAGILEAVVPTSPISASDFWPR